mgnify:CR=1 FL=1
MSAQRKKDAVECSDLGSVETREKKGGGDTFPIAPPLIFNNPRAKRRSSKHRERCIHLWRTHSFRKDTLECDSFDDALQRASAILARPGVRDVARSSKPFWMKGILKTLTQKWIKTTRKDYLKRRAWRTCIFLEYQEKHIKTCIDTRFIRSQRISARKLLASIYALDKYISHFSSAKQSLQNPQHARKVEKKISESVLTCCRAVSRPSWTFRWRPCRWRRRWSFGRFGLGQWIAWLCIYVCAFIKWRKREEEQGIILYLYE